MIQNNLIAIPGSSTNKFLTKKRDNAKHEIKNPQTGSWFQSCINSILMVIQPSYMHGHVTTQNYLHKYA